MASFKSETLQILSERGFVNQHTDIDGLDNALKSGMVTAYCGYDPTADSLHVGHLITLMMLHWLQKTGHRPITLMGGGTALVGDPSFKSETRPMMSEETIAANIAGLKQACGPILRYGDAGNGAIMVNNAAWLKKIGYLEFLREYGAHFSVNKMLSFDSVKLRLDREQHLSFLEFNYSLLQAYDFVELYKNYNCTLQIAGADQWGNIVSGTELGRKKLNVTLYGLTASLLTDASGKKMGKSEGNALWLNPNMQSDYDYYQYWRNVDDSMVGKMLRLFTVLPIAEINKLEQLRDRDINEAKKILAFEATKMMRGAAAAQLAADTAQQTFAGTGRSDNLPKFPWNADDGFSVIDMLVKAELAESRGAARRLIEGNAIKVNDNTITDPKTNLSKDDFTEGGMLKLSAGKKKHVLFYLEN
jgi:tyrosyl-tRNA synthetase